MSETNERAKMKLYKVLVNGESCHGGSLCWSLPANGNPGDWHEVAGEVALCSRGLHLTSDPARWWKPECAIFEVEADGVVGDCSDDSRKCVARRVRLMREVGDVVELAALRIFREGAHSVGGGDVAIALDSSRVTALDSSRVTARDSSQVTARGSSQVTALDSSRVTARGSVTLVSWKGRDGIKIMERAVCVDRSGETSPVVVTADGELAPKPAKKRKAKAVAA